MKNTYGTGCFLVMNTGEKKVASKHGLLTTVSYKFGNAPVQYALEGSIAITGALVQWVRDNLGMIKDSSEIETLARSVEDNGGVYIVARVFRAVCAVLEGLRARRHRGPDSLCEQGTHRTRRAGSDGFPDQGSG